MSTDYTRLFAMLRPVRSGMDGVAGFARIEVRSGRGRVGLNVQGMKSLIGTDVRGVLLGGPECEYFCDLGPISISAKGQGGLFYEFLPQNVSGAPLERYHTAAVILKEKTAARPVLAGVFGKNGVRDWEKALLPLKQDDTEMEEAASALHSLEEQVSTTAEEEPIPDQMDSSTQTISTESENSSPAVAAVISSCVRLPPAIDAPGCEKEVSQEQDTVDIQKVETVSPTTTIQVDSFVWQGHSHAMRELFEKHPAVAPFEDAANMIFVEIPMPVKSVGADHYILGAHEKDGEIDALCIGIPGTYNIVPPAGLEGACWQASSQESHGYWLTWQDGYTGYPIAFHW